MKTNHNKKEGYILLVCLTFVTALTIGAALTLKIGKQEAYSKQREQNTLRAKLAAETGIRKVYREIKNDPDIRQCADFQNSMGTVTFDIQELKNKSAILVTATGKSNGVESDVAVIISLPSSDGNSGGTTTQESIDWFANHLIFTGDNFTMSNDGKILYQKMDAYVGANFRATGGSSGGANEKSKENNPGIMEIIGTVQIDNNAQVKPDIYCTTAPVILDSAKHMGTYHPADVPVRTVSLNLIPFQKNAKENDQSSGVYYYVGTSITDPYISANEMNGGHLAIWNQTTVAPVGGILWVEGDLTIGAESDVHADAIIATGNITIQGNAKQNASDKLLLASTHGNVHITGGNKISVDCLLYADQGNVTVDNGVSLTGRVIAPNGSFTLAGGATLKGDKKNDNYDDQFVIVTPTDPQDPTTGTEYPKIAAWIK